jgi:hypothetical protein
VRYTEQQRRPSTALRQTAMSPGCGCSSASAPSGGCGCGGSTANAKSPGGCGCGSSSGSSSVSYGGAAHGSSGGAATSVKTSTTYATASNLLLGACEPSRIVEGYAFSVCKSDGHCPDPAAALKNTIVGCFTGLLELAKARMESEDSVVVASAFTGTASIAKISPAKQYAALCRFREFTLDVLQDDTFGLSCGLPCAGYDIVIPEPNQDHDLAQGENGAAYAGRSAEALKGMVALIVEHLRQCICQALEPPCGPDPCEDSIPLGCVVISKDDVISVCSLSGRHYAGSFPALAYWISLGPLIATALCKLCCTPIYRGGKAKEKALFAMLDSVDPSGALRKTAGAQGFAAPKYYADQVRRVLRSVKLATLLKKLRLPQDGINVASFLDQSPAKARTALTNAGLTVDRIKLKDSANAPGISLLAVPPAVRPGEHVTLYEHDGEIVGYTVGGFAQGGEQ